MNILRTFLLLLFCCLSFCVYPDALNGLAANEHFNRHLSIVQRHKRANMNWEQPNDRQNWTNRLKIEVNCTPLPWGFARVCSRSSFIGTLDSHIVRPTKLNSCWSTKMQKYVEVRAYCDLCLLHIFYYFSFHFFSIHNI